MRWFKEKEIFDALWKGLFPGRGDIHVVLFIPRKLGSDDGGEWVREGKDKDMGTGEEGDLDQGK